MRRRSTDSALLTSLMISYVADLITLREASSLIGFKKIMKESHLHKGFRYYVQESFFDDRYNAVKGLMSDLEKQGMDFNLGGRLDLMSDLDKLRGLVKHLEDTYLLWIKNINAMRL